MEKIRRQSNFQYSYDDTTNDEDTNVISTNTNTTASQQPILSPPKHAPPPLPTYISNNNNNNNNKKSSGFFSSFSSKKSKLKTPKETQSTAKLISSSKIPQSPLLLSKNLKNQSLKDDKDKFRYLYQIRRFNGDVLSKDFIDNIQKKLNSTDTNSSSRLLSKKLIKNEINDLIQDINVQNRPNRTNDGLGTSSAETTLNSNP